MPKVKSKKFSSKHTSPAPGGGRKSQKSAEPYHKLICELQKEYKRNGNAQYAVAAKSYMRNQFECYGIKAPERRAIDKKVCTVNCPFYLTSDMKSYARNSVVISNLTLNPFQDQNEAFQCV